MNHLIKHILHAFPEQGACFYVLNAPFKVSGLFCFFAGDLLTLPTPNLLRVVCNIPADVDRIEITLTSRIVGVLFIEFITFCGHQDDWD